MIRHALLAGLLLASPSAHAATACAGPIRFAITTPTTSALALLGLQARNGVVAQTTLNNLSAAEADGAVAEVSRARGLTVLLVEQNAAAALDIAARAYVLETGRVVLEGPSATLKGDPRIQSAYLGG